MSHEVSQVRERDANYCVIRFKRSCSSISCLPRTGLWPRREGEGGKTVMCNFNPKNNGRFIDPCLKREIDVMERAGFRILACCCGHGRYPQTIVIRWRFGKILEYEHGVVIPRKRRFYRRDSDGFYYIPEISQPKKVKGGGA